MTQYSRHTQPSVVVHLNIHSYNLNRLYKIYNEVYATWRLVLLIVVSQKPCILITRGILFTNYRKTLYTNCTLFNRLIIVSGYNKIVHFLIKNELQSPYIKDP